MGITQDLCYNASRLRAISARVFAHFGLVCERPDRPTRTMLDEAKDTGSMLGRPALSLV